MCLKKIINRALLFVVPLIVLSCGNDQEKGESANVAINFVTTSVNKNTYQIIDSDGDNNIEVVGPSFRFTFFITNNSQKLLTVSNFTVTVKGRDSSGQDKEVEWTPDFPDNQIVINIVNTGETTSAQTAFVDGLPDAETPRYSVEVEFVGWFAGDDDPATDNIDESQLPGEDFFKRLNFRVQSQN